MSTTTYNSEKPIAQTSNLFDITHVETEKRVLHPINFSATAFDNSAEVSRMMMELCMRTNSPQNIYQCLKLGVSCDDNNYQPLNTFTSSA